jgi:hypothetical protein
MDETNVSKKIGLETEVSVLIAHYEQTRENIMFFVRARDQYIYYAVTAIALIYSFALTNEDHVRILFTVSIISAVSAILYAQAEMTIGVLCLWLKTEYSDKLREIFGQDVPHWDASNISQHFFSPIVFGRRSVALAVLYGATNLGALYILAEHCFVGVSASSLEEVVFLEIKRLYFLLGFFSIFLMLMIYSLWVVLRIVPMRADLHHKGHRCDEDE